MRTVSEAKGKVAEFHSSLAHEAARLGMRITPEPVTTDTTFRIRRGDFEPNHVRLLIVHYPRDERYALRVMDMGRQITNEWWCSEDIAQFCIDALDYAVKELLKAREALS